MGKIYYIQDIERILKVKRDNIYYWEEVGKIPQAKREPMSNYRYWTEKDIKKLKKITGR